MDDASCYERDALKAWMSGEDDHMLADTVVNIPKPRHPTLAASANKRHMILGLGSRDGVVGCNGRSVIESCIVSRVSLRWITTSALY